MKKIFEIVRAWLHPKDLTKKELIEIQEMWALIERARTWEESYMEHETPEQRQQRAILESLLCIIW